MHISQELAFLWISFTYHEPSIIFYLKLFCFGKNEPIKVHIFRLAIARMKVNQIPYVIFRANSQFFFK